jgi:uncharacterized protein YegL
MKDFTHIAVLLDRSGSMESVRAETISGYNHFVKEQREAGDNASLTLVQFDSGGIDTLQEMTPIKAVPDLNSDTYQPRGMTPLLDALGRTIESTGKQLAAIPEDNRPDKVVFVVITDGQENASHQFTKAKIAEMIGLQEGAYKWNFVYLGANQDAFVEARGMNINVATAAAFAGTPDSMRASYAVTSSNLKDFRRTNQRTSLNYTDLQRARMLKKS